MNDVAVILYSVTRATCVNNGPAGLRLRFLVCRLPVARGYMRYSCDFSKKIPSCHRPYYVTSLQRRLSSDSVCPRTGYCLRGSIVDKLCVLLDSHVFVEEEESSSLLFSHVFVGAVSSWRSVVMTVSRPF